MKFITIDQIGKLEPLDFVTPFRTKQGSLFFVTSTFQNMKQAIQEVECFETMSGLRKMARPLRVDDFQVWMSERIEEELAFYIDEKEV